MAGSRGDSLGTHRNSMRFRISSSPTAIWEARIAWLRQWWPRKSSAATPILPASASWEAPMSPAPPRTSKNRSTSIQSMADAALSISNLKFVKWNSPCDGWAAANWKTRAAQSAVTPTSARHRASAPSPTRSPGGSPWSAGWVPAVEASPSPRPLGKSWRGASSKKSKNIISS